MYNASLSPQNWRFVSETTDNSNGRAETVGGERDITEGGIETVESVFYGHLTEVDFSTNTALLQEGFFTDDIRLEFTDDLKDDFRLYIGKYVEVSGEAEYASYDDGGDLISPLRVRLINDGTMDNGSLDAFTEPKIFDPSKAEKADWDFDSEEFIRVIKEGRNGLRE